MKKLLIVHSISPYKGSEDYIGWNWLIQLSKNAKINDEIYVITRSFNEKDVKKGLKENNINNINLIIVDVPNYLDWYKEKYRLFHHLYYVWWQYFVYRWIKKSKLKFDIMHHATMNDYRIYSLIYKFKDSYTIFGPVGGAQITPKALEVYETEKLRFRFRKFINKTCTINPFYRNAIKNYKKIYAINNETKIQIEKITKKECELLPELALKESFKNLPLDKKKNRKIRILYVGRLIGKKGIYMLIDIIKNMPKNLNYVVEIYGGGPEKEKLESMISTYNLNNILIMGERKFAEISNAYSSADIFIMPSLRETSGNVLLEAMAYSLPIVALDTSFAHQLKKENCGFFIEPNKSRTKIIEEFDNALCNLIQDNNLRNKMGKNGYNYVNSNFDWGTKYQIIYNNKNIKLN